MDTVYRTPAARHHQPPLPTLMKSAVIAPLARPESLCDQVYQTLYAMVSRGEIDPGSRLTETRLAAQLGVSRTPVREALARLRQEGLLDLSPRGAALSPLSREDVEEIMEMRLLLEPHIAARAASRLPAGAAGVQRLAPLRAAFERETAAASGSRAGERFAAANRDFRAALVALAGNRRLAETARRFDSQLQALRHATLNDARNRAIVLRHHRALAAAVSRRDAAGAERVMRELMQAARLGALALLDSARAERAAA